MTPEVSDDLHSAAVTVEAACENTSDGTEVLFAIEGVGEQTAAVQDGKAVTVFYMENVHLWDGVADPYLYSIAASLPGGDAVAVHFGCRKSRSSRIQASGSTAEMSALWARRGIRIAQDSAMR